VADASGVVLDAVEAISARAAAKTRALLAGEPVAQVMGADYEHMLE
jgi:hypothetical protein